MGNNVIQEHAANGSHHNSSSLLDKADETTVDADDDDDDSKLNLAELAKETGRLRAQLLAIQTQRRRIKELKRKSGQFEEALKQQINECRHEQDEAFTDLQSALANRSYKEVQLENMQRWMSLNDCFFIGTQGPFATINGLRLGAEALVENFDSMRLLPSISGGDKSSNNYKNNSLSSTQRRSVSTDSFYSNRGGTVSRENIAGAVPVLLSVKVPWSEVNSALGQLALLLSIIEKTPNCGIRYRHEILCMGSTSKMGIRRNGSNSVTYYNLHSDDSFQFFGRRNFNTALQCLLQCVLDASEYIREKDPTITLPHPIEKPSATNSSAANTRAGEVTVGGLSVAYGTDGVEWTRAMKYLLTNMKHLLLFRPLGLWGSAPQSFVLSPVQSNS